MEMLFPRKRLSILINTGVPDPSNRLSFRLVAGVWSLAAFIFVQAYTSTLITYVVTPVNPPLVSSAYDLVDKKDINVLVRKSGAIDTMFSASISNFDSVICFVFIRCHCCPVISHKNRIRTIQSYWGGLYATESILFHNLGAG
jgi:hypothetical protein